MRQLRPKPLNELLKVAQLVKKVLILDPTVFGQGQEGCHWSLLVGECLLFWHQAIAK